MTRQILVTSALPYANGPIHIGHLVEYIQTDIWVRFQKLQGNRCLYFCADDTHGTAIMIRARSEGRSEEELIASMSEAHQRDFAGFGIEFDHYGSTHSQANRELCAEFWQALHSCIDRLPQRIAQVFKMREMDDVPSKAVCSALNISEANLWVMLHRARKALRLDLEMTFFEGKGSPTL